MNWQLQEAKNKFSELVKRARTEGPQTVTVRGERQAVVMSAEEFDALMLARIEPDKPKRSLLEALTTGPEWDDEMYEAVNARNRPPMRDVEF